MRWGKKEKICTDTYTLLLLLPGYKHSWLGDWLKAMAWVFMALAFGGAGWQALLLSPLH